MGWFDSFFHPEQAYESAENALQKGYGESQGYLKPWINQGQQQYGALMGARDKLLNPAALTNEWSNAYEASPYAKQLLNQNMEQGQEAASQMGLNGSSAALGNIQTGAGNIVKSDRENFLNRLMQQYMQGIGIGTNIYGTGASAGSTGSANALTQAQNMAGLEYGREAAPGKMFGQMLGYGANFIPGAQGASAFMGAANKFNPFGGGA